MYFWLIPIKLGQIDVHKAFYLLTAKGRDLLVGGRGAFGKHFCIIKFISLVSSKRIEAFGFWVT